MAKLLKAIKQFNPENNTLEGIAIRYRVSGGDIRGLFITSSEIAGLTKQEIRIIAQQKANQDTGLSGGDPLLDLDIIPDIIQDTRMWFKNNPQLRAFFEQDIADIESDLESIYPAELPPQLLAVIKGLVMIARAYGILEIAD